MHAICRLAIPYKNKCYVGNEGKLPKIDENSFDWTSSGQSKGVTLVTVTYKRAEFLETFITFHQNCDIVKEIVVVQNNDEPVEPGTNIPPAVNKSDKARIIQMDTNSLHNAFWPIENITTSAVLQADDDIEIPCSDIERIYNAWTKEPKAQYGFYAKAVIPTPTCAWDYYGTFKTLFWNGAYDMVSTKGSMYHHNWHFYFKDALPLDQIFGMDPDIQFRCDDITMAFLTSYYSGL